VQLLAEKEILIVVASLVVHYCTIKKNVIVASRLYDFADVQFTVEQCFSTGVSRNHKVLGVSVARGSTETYRWCLERN